MKTSISSARYRWGFTLVVTNLAVLMVLLVLLNAGELRTARDFLQTLAYTLIFSNLTAALGMVVITRLIGRFARRRPASMVPISIAGFVVILPTGCLAAQALLTALHLVPASNFWRQYLHTLKVATPLALVFGLGAVAYASLRARLEETEFRLRAKELAEERALKLAAEARLRSLESWIHPHFLFNTLNSISALIPLDPARAEQIVGRLATLLRAALDSGRHSLIPLPEEMALVESYLDIERVRLGSRLRASIDMPAALAAARVPPMSVQSLVENAVKYGIVPQPAGGAIVITATNGAGEDSVRIAISDTGPAFDLASIPAGHGLDKLVQRLEALFGDKAGLSVSRRDGLCVVEMQVPTSLTVRL
jgi:two-component system, LytTR family, sensor histidine kinase AlgZ